MSRPFRNVAPLALMSLLALSSLLSLMVLPGCSTMNEVAALRLLTFAFAGVSDVRFVGIPIGPGSGSGSLGIADAARLAAAIIAKQAPMDMVVHVSATNPPENKVTARMVDLGWTLFVEDHQALTGQLGSAVSIPPGRTADVPLTAHFDLLQLGSGGASDLFDLAVAIAGQGVVRKDLRLELVPSVDTSIGPIRFPAPVVVTRMAAR
jgi:hypothetical protein